MSNIFYFYLPDHERRFELGNNSDSHLNETNTYSQFQAQSSDQQLLIGSQLKANLISLQEDEDDDENSLRSSIFENLHQNDSKEEEKTYKLDCPFIKEENLKNNILSKVNQELKLNNEQKKELENEVQKYLQPERVGEQSGQPLPTEPRTPKRKIKKTKSKSPSTNSLYFETPQWKKKRFLNRKSKRRIENKQFLTKLLKNYAEKLSVKRSKFHFSMLRRIRNYVYTFINNRINKKLEKNEKFKGKKIIKNSYIHHGFNNKAVNLYLLDQKISDIASNEYSLLSEAKKRKLSKKSQNRNAIQTDIKESELKKYILTEKHNKELIEKISEEENSEVGKMLKKTFRESFQEITLGKKIYLFENRGYETYEDNNNLDSEKFKMLNEFIRNVVIEELKKYRNKKQSLCDTFIYVLLLIETVFEYETYYSNKEK